MCLLQTARDGRGLAKQRNGDAKNGDAELAAALAIDPAIGQASAWYRDAPVSAETEGIILAIFSRGDVWYATAIGTIVDCSRVPRLPYCGRASATAPAVDRLLQHELLPRLSSSDASDNRIGKRGVNIPENHSNGI
jgi:hypothetical protein